jgi:hypothetical protein
MADMSIRINNKEKKAYVILGAPHSATSFISKSLEASGVNMGSDTDGLFQNKSFVMLNSYILSKAGGTWHSPPSEDEIIKTNCSWKIRKFVEESESDFWGFKDPRTSLTIKNYLPYLGGDTYLICCFRRPKKVLESYAIEDKRVTIGLIDKYNKSIISAVTEFCEL